METDEAKEVRGPQRQGTLLQGRYEITAVQEEFAHAVFYAAFDHSLSQRVCIKTAAGASQPRPAQEWLWEAKVQMRLDHRAIPHCLNYFEEEGVPYIVMEELYETRLSDLLGQERLGMERIHGMALQLMDVLGCIHDAGYVCLNVSPGQIRVNARDEIMLYDFSFLTRSGKRITHLPQAELAQHLAPEEFSRHGRARRSSDVYALGATLYEMISGKVPLSARRRQRITERYHREILEKLCSIDEEVPPHVDRAIQRSMSLKPDERFQNMADFRDAMERECRIQEEKRRMNRRQRVAVGMILLNCLLIVCLILGLLLHEKSRFHPSLIQGELQVCLPYRDEREYALNAQIASLYARKYPQVELQLTQLPASEYAEALDVQPLPDVFFYEDGIDEALLADLSDLQEAMDLDDLFGFTRHEQLVKMPLAWDSEIHYVSTKGSGEAATLAAFLDQEGSAWNGSITALPQISEQLAGYWDIAIPEVITVEYEDEMCVKRSTRNKESAGMLFIYEMLGEQAQSGRYLQDQDLLPLNRQILSEYVRIWPQLAYVLETGIPLEIKEGGG